MNAVLLSNDLYVALNRFLGHEEEQGERSRTNRRPRSYPDCDTESETRCEDSIYANYLKMRSSNTEDKPKASKRSESTIAEPEMPTTSQQMSQFRVDLWSPVTNQTKFVRPSSADRSRSTSAPAAPDSQPDCQRGIDKFCSVEPPNPNNYLGLQRGRQQNSPTELPAPTCEAKEFTQPQSGYDAMRAHAPGSTDNSYDADYQQCLHMQKQQHQQKEHSPYSPYQKDNDQGEGTYENFNPALNSTMIAYRQQHQPPQQQQHHSPTQQQHHPRQQQQHHPPQQQHHPPQQQHQPPHQQQHQPPHQQQQHHPPQQQHHPPQQPTQQHHQPPTKQRLPPWLRGSTSDPDANQLYNSRNIMQRPHDQNMSYDNTTYMQLPAATPNPQQQPLAAAQTQRATYIRPAYRQPTNVSLSDHYRKQQPMPPDCWPSTSQNISYTARQNVSQGYRPGASCSTAANPSKCESPFSNSCTAEDRYIQRTNTLFFNALVMDQSCPGIIQNTLNGKDDFNDYALNIAFGGKLPEKPVPIDPITMLEAIQMRIDYEREEIRKKSAQNNPDNREEDTMTEDSKKAKERARCYGKDYYGKDCKKNKTLSQKIGKLAGANRKKRQLPDLEDIDRHFCMKNESEVNSGVQAFLKAEAAYNYGMISAEPKNILADINMHESDFFGLPIKMKVYNGTTWPTD